MLSMCEPIVSYANKEWAYTSVQSNDDLNNQQPTFFLIFRIPFLFGLRMKNVADMIGVVDKAIICAGSCAPLQVNGYAVEFKTGSRLCIECVRCMCSVYGVWWKWRSIVANVALSFFTKSEFIYHT